MFLWDQRCFYSGYVCGREAALLTLISLSIPSRLRPDFSAADFEHASVPFSSHFVLKSKLVPRKGKREGIKAPAGAGGGGWIWKRFSAAFLNFAPRGPKLARILRSKLGS